VNVLAKEEWLTMLGIDSDDLKQKLEKICSDIRVKDKTFKYRFYEQKEGKYKFILAIGSESKDKAFMRGAWFVKKAQVDQKLLYWVKQKKRSEQIGTPPPSRGSKLD